MSEGSAAPIAPTPGNFSAGIAANVAASSPAPTTTASAPAAQPRPLPTPVAPTPAEDPTAAFNAALQQQQPANDNAQPQQVEDLATQLQDPNAAPPDPLAGQIHGVEKRAILEAIDNGQLPAELLEKLTVIANPNGRELPVSVEEARRGYMRISDYTRGTQQIAQSLGQVEEVKGKLRGLFEGWDKPEGFEQGMFRMGLLPQARAVVTKNWGTPQQPNVQGFLDDMRRLGHWDTFQQAAETYANQWAAEQRLDPAVRADLQRQRDEMWRARLGAETEMESSKRKAWEQERDQLLQQRQQRPDPRQQQEHLQTIHGLKEAGFQRFGVKRTPVADQYFVENFKALDRIARQNRQSRTVEQLVAEAVQATAEQLGDMGHQHSAIAQAPANTNGTRVQAAPQQPQTLAARPAAAPTTTATPVPSSGSPEDFRKRMVALAGMGQQRR